MTEMLAPLNSLFVRMLAAMEPEERVGILKCFCAQCGTCLARFDKEGKVQGNPTGPLAFLDNPQGIGKNLCPNCASNTPIPLGTSKRLAEGVVAEMRKRAPYVAIKMGEPAFADGIWHVDFIWTRTPTDIVRAVMEVDESLIYVHRLPSSPGGEVEEIASVTTVQAASDALIETLGIPHTCTVDHPHPGPCQACGQV